MNVSQRVGSGYFKDLCGCYFCYPHTFGQSICGETAFSDLALVLGALTETPAEPLDVECLKVALLLALASLERIPENTPKLPSAAPQSVSQSLCRLSLGLLTSYSR